MKPRDSHIKIKIKAKETIHFIDPTFIDVVEPESIEVTSAVPSEPCLVGAKIVQGTLRVTVGQGKTEYVTVKISGIRAGRKDKRFPVYSEEEANRNTQFWDQWKQQE